MTHNSFPVPLAVSPMAAHSRQVCRRRSLIRRVLGYTHIFTPNTINVAHVGFNHLHSTRFGPEGSVQGIPAQYGIQGIPQSAENGGLPNIDIAGLSNLGSNDYLPSDEVSQTLQVMDDFTKIYGKHSFKTGIEFQNVDFNTLQPAYSRGEFDFGGSSRDYTGIPFQDGDNTGRAQFLLTPTVASVPGGISGVGWSKPGACLQHQQDLRHADILCCLLPG